MFRSAALNQYTAASIDALTDLTASPEVAHHVESLALGIGTSGDDIQPETIARAFDHAREWLRWLAGGSVHIEGLDPVGGGGAASGGSGVRYRSRTRLIDRDAEDGDFDARDPRL